MRALELQRRNAEIELGGGQGELITTLDDYGGVGERTPSEWSRVVWLAQLLVHGSRYDFIHVQSRSSKSAQQDSLK